MINDTKIKDEDISEELEGLKKGSSSDLSNKDIPEVEKLSKILYMQKARDIVDASRDELKKSSKFNRIFRIAVGIVFALFIIASVGVLCALLYNNSKICVELIVVYMGTFMVELIASICVLMKLVFDDKYQSGIIKVMNSFLETYKIVGEYENLKTKTKQ